jgi:hypothetical protein
MVRLQLISMSLFASFAVACATDELATDPIDRDSDDTPNVTQTTQALTRPAFKMPFLCGQLWRGNNWHGHDPAHAIDWNHYDADGSPDDFGRRVVASAGGTVLQSYYSTSNGYGHVIVIGHGDGWRTRYAHLSERLVAEGATVTMGRVIGRVGASSAIYNLSPHLHYEQIHDGSVVVSVIQGVTWSDFTNRNQTSTNDC